MNFKDFQHSFGKFKTNVEGQIVRNISYRHRNTKQLSFWIFREGDDLSSLKTLNYQHSETNKALLEWISEDVQNTSDNEEDQGEGEKGREQDNDSLKDLVGDKIVGLFNKQVEIEQEYAEQLKEYRQVIKSIRAREEIVDDIREHRKVLQYRLNQLESKRSKRFRDKITDLQALVAATDQEKQKAESELAVFKRVALREAFYLRFNALAKYAEKASIIAGFGKYLADLFDSPGNDHDKYNEQVANTIFSDAMQALTQWTPTQSDERPTLTRDLPKNAKENENENNNGKNRNKKNKLKKKGKDEKDKDEEEPLTPPELPPRQHRVGLLDPSALENHSPSSSTMPHFLYHNRGFSSGSASSNESKENSNSSKPYQEAPPPSYTACLSTTSLNEISSRDTTPNTSQVRLEIQTEEEHTDHPYPYHDSGPSNMSSPYSFFSHQPIEQINRQIQNKCNNKRSYMEFSQQYTHRQQTSLQLSHTIEPTRLPPPLPRSRSLATLPLSLAAPSAPTEDELFYLPIPSAPPPSEF